MHAIDGMACAKRGCDNRGKLGLNIVGHGSFPTKWGRRWRYRCTVCGGTVSTHTGTAYSGLRCARREFDQVASLRGRGVGARMRAGRRASNRRARHLPMRYETGLPSSVIRFRTLHASTASRRCPDELRARRPSPTIDVYRKNAFSTRAC